jgi:translation initiation factor 2B subunit (eIF-2B alpha/beta/delta family)
MTERELGEGYHFLRKEFYSLGNICRRIARLNEISSPDFAQLMYAVFNNIAGRQTLIDSFKSLKTAIKNHSDRN